MVDLSLDLDPTSPTYKDLLVRSGDMVLTSDADPTGTDPVLQNVLQRLNFYFSEWFLDNTQGVPWIQQILVKNPDQSKVDAILRNTIQGTPGITQLNSYSFSFNKGGRSATISFQAQKTNGTITYSGTLTAQGGS